MTNLQTRIVSPPLRKADCACMGSEEWLTERGLAPDEVDRMLSQLPAGSARDFLMRSSDSSFVRGPYLVPKSSSTELKFPPDVSAVHEVNPETIAAIIKLAEQLEKTPYEVIIRNSTVGDLEQLTITFYLNKLIGKTIQPTGPFTKSLDALPAGETAGFQLTTNCLEMADRYFIQCVFNGTQLTFAQFIPDINKKEQEEGVETS